MSRNPPQRILLIGDDQREIYPAVVGAVPGVAVTSVSSVFDAIAELSAGRYSTVLASAEPIERRPEAAVKVLREVAGEARIVLFGHPTLELLSRKMLQFGCDDYLITPASSGELRQVLSVTTLQLADENGDIASDQMDATVPPERSTQEPPFPSVLEKIPLAELLLDTMLQHPHDAPAAALREINSRMPSLQLVHTAKGTAAPVATEGQQVVSHELHSGEGTLHLVAPLGQNIGAARHTLAQLAFLVGKLFALQDRHNRLQKLAITDELTGAYNGRYFRHFLARILEKARAMRFPVTLLLFDIDDFKKYNDRYGHGVGDEILAQTASMMRRCVRDHDLVARIGGDEFAVVFWEKEGPRQPRDPNAVAGSRPPQTPLQIFERFKRLMSDAEFSGLGSTGRGTLGISAGLAVFPYDATDAQGLIKAADHFLMFGAKQGGKNSIYLVGGDEGRPSAGDD